MSKERKYPGQLERTCPICQETFFTWPSEIKRGGGILCSAACYRSNEKLKPPVDRFWEKVQKSDGCWMWTGANTGGKWPYGVLGAGRAGEGLLKAHTFSWELHNNQTVPNGLCVLHKCDVTLCVNPDHLFIGTLMDNTQDMVAKGRARGGRPKGSKLTPESLESFRRKRGYYDV